MHRGLCLVTSALIVGSFFPVVEASAYDILPYAVRTHSYNGINTTAFGDLRTVGMAGATIGLGDTYIASVDNPAGLAMTVNGVDSNYSENIIYDGTIQNFDNAVRVNSFGTALSSYPWGFSFGFSMPYSEGQQYGRNGDPNDPITLSILTRQFQLGVARLFFENRLAIGMNLVLGQAQEQIVSTTTSTSAQSFSLGAVFGATLQLRNHLLFGLSYRTSSHYPFDSTNQPTPHLPNFFQSIEVPGRFGIGLGWIPNRLFRADFSTFIIDSSPQSALLSNDATWVGLRMTVQPRLGIAYHFLEYKEFKATLFLGNYLETSRTEGAGVRVHQTAAIEVKPWIFKLGWGIDYSNNYRNYLGTIGIDIVNALAKIDLIPSAWHPPYAGLAPNPTLISDEGLSRPLVKNWKQNGPDMDPLKIGLDIPKRIEKKALEIKHQFFGTPKELKHPHSEVKKPKHEPKKRRLIRLQHSP